MALDFREMQIKTTVRYHLTSVRMAIITKPRSKCGRRGETGNLVCCRWERKVVQLLWKMVRKFLQRLNIELPCDSVISLLENSQEKYISVHKKKHLYVNVHSSPVHRPQKVEATPVSVSR